MENGSEVVSAYVWECVWLQMTNIIPVSFLSVAPTPVYIENKSSYWSVIMQSAEILKSFVVPNLWNSFLFPHLKKKYRDSNQYIAIVYFKIGRNYFSVFLG